MSFRVDGIRAHAQRRTAIRFIKPLCPTVFESSNATFGLDDS